MPQLSIRESGSLVCLNLGGLAQGEGPSLQEAGDDLIRRLLEIVLTVRSSGFKAPCELGPDFETMDFLHELGEIAAGGGDIRSRVFG